MNVMCEWGGRSEQVIYDTVKMWDEGKYSALIFKCKYLAINLMKTSALWNFYCSRFTIV